MAMRHFLVGDEDDVAATHRAARDAFVAALAALAFGLFVLIVALVNG
jgi:hypothetical protein